jgi:hypothetical protein
MHFPSISVCSEGAALPGEPFIALPAAMRPAHSVQQTRGAKKKATRYYSNCMLKLAIQL